MFYLRSVSLVYLIFLIASCGEQKIEERPDKILDKEHMAKVMVDVQLLESTLNLNIYNSNQIDSTKTNPRFEIFEKNNTSKEQYEESFAYYSSHLEEFEEVYELVLIEFNRMTAELAEIKDESSAPQLSKDERYKIRRLKLEENNSLKE